MENQSWVPEDDTSDTYVFSKLPASAMTKFVFPLSPPFNQRTRSFSNSHVGSLAAPSLLSNFDCPLFMSRTRISEVFEWDWNE